MLHTFAKQATENKLFVILVSMNTTNKHTQHNNAKGPQKGKKKVNFLKG